MSGNQGCLGKNFNYDSRGPVRVLTGTAPAARREPHEAAFVYAIEDQGKSLVDDLRRRFPCNAPPDLQLLPHLTLLFLGGLAPELLDRLISALDECAASLTAEAILSDVAIFSTPGGAQTVYLAAEPAEALREQHRLAERVCASLDWRRVSLWSDRLYTPHVTIWERATAADTAALLAEKVGPVRTRLARPIVIGRPLSSLRHDL